MIITIDNVITKIKEGKLDLPNIHKCNLTQLREINTSGGLFFGIRVGGDKFDDYYVALKIVDNGNSCNLCYISVDKDSGYLSYGEPIIGTINKRYVYKVKNKIKEHYANE